MESSQTGPTGTDGLIVSCKLRKSLAMSYLPESKGHCTAIKISPVTQFIEAALNSPVGTSSALTDTHRPANAIHGQRKKTRILVRTQFGSKTNDMAPLVMHGQDLFLALVVECGLEDGFRFFERLCHVPVTHSARGTLELALLHPGKDLSEHGDAGFRVGVVPRTHPESMKVEVPKDEEGGGDLEGLPRHGSVGDDVRAVGEETTHVHGRRPADTVERQLDSVSTQAPLGVKLRLDPLLVLELSVRDDVVRTEGEQFLPDGFVTGTVPDDVDGAVTPETTHLDGGFSDRRVGPVLDEPVATLHGGKVLEHAVGGTGVDAHRGHVDGVDAPRHRDLEQVFRLGEGVRPPGPERGPPHDGPLTQVPLHRHAVPARLDDLHQTFVSPDGGGSLRVELVGEGRSLWVDALDLVEIRRVDGRREETDEELVVRRLWDLVLVNPELLLRIAVLGIDHGPAGD